MLQQKHLLIPTGTQRLIQASAPAMQGILDHISGDVGILFAA